MNLDAYFKLTSYAVVACGALALLAAGGINFVIAFLFAIFAVLAWRLEDSRWQISERLGLALILLSLPLFYLDWQYQAAILARERAGAATLAHLILCLSVVKLLQKKIDRDWVFLYLISFFEILLAAGLSISPAFLAVLVLYLLFSACTIVAFEMRKAERHIKVLSSVQTSKKKNPKQKNVVWRLPLTASAILLLITILAAPLFFLMPRGGSAGFGSGGGNKVSSFSGFADSVDLGRIGQIQQNNEVVMRVRVEQPSNPRNQNLRWRGVALDTFDNFGWRSSKREREPKSSDNGVFRFGLAENLTTQTFYLEPIDAPVLFAAGRVVGVQGSFPTLAKDSEDALYLFRNYGDRLTYKVFSDTELPPENVLRADKSLYPTRYERYLHLPKIDSRIVNLAKQITEQSGAKNRYDAAKAIEQHLQTNYGYTLDLKVGGKEPLANFLFEIGEGHCEYFATALAVMLRSQGIAARVVNGFQTGTYNDAADVYTVTQKEAHSWVEVYFPESQSWVVFDATPAAGRNLGQQELNANPLLAQFNKYAEAMQMFWLQYVVGYDNQEQLSLARNLRFGLMQNQERFSDFWTQLQKRATEWWKAARGDNGTLAGWQTIGQTLLGLALIVGIALSAFVLAKRLGHLRFWREFGFGGKISSAKVVEFYERMTKALDKRGLRRGPAQTPLEFATALAMPEAMQITEAYHRVRFDEQILTQKESARIERWLKSLEQPAN